MISSTVRPKDVFRRSELVKIGVLLMLLLSASNVRNVREDRFLDDLRFNRGVVFCALLGSNYENYVAVMQLQEE
jgi:hypothetical protein